MSDLWPTLTAIMYLGLATVASIHALLNKSDSKSAVGWVGVIWLSPLVGTFFYFVLGVNRIKRKAHALMPQAGHANPSTLNLKEDLGERFTDEAEKLAAIGRKISGHGITPGNQVDILIDGDQAYPEMLAAIDTAKETVYLQTFIFGRDEVGRKFVKHLAKACKRGVDVRVLVDAVGVRYSLPSIIPELVSAGVPTKRFLPPVFPGRLVFSNLRNHRKMLLIDDHLAFTGGMNIRDHHLASHGSRFAADLHFKVRGPVVRQLFEVFAKDWSFAAGRKAKKFSQTKPSQDSALGSAYCRSISDGPDSDFEKARWIYIGAISSAKKSIKIMTPYFLPDTRIMTALGVAALRDVQVDILVPQNNNIMPVHWAMLATVWQILQRGCRIHLSQGNFDHSKVMLVDDYWTCLGSSNWDERSLRLNFELNLEVFDPELTQRLHAHFDEKRDAALLLDLHTIRKQSLPAKIRNNFFRLLSPYL